MPSLSLPPNTGCFGSEGRSFLVWVLFVWGGLWVLFVFFVCCGGLLFLFCKRKKRWLAFEQKKSVRHEEGAGSSPSQDDGKHPRAKQAHNLLHGLEPAPITYPSLWHSALKQHMAWNHGILGSLHPLTSTYPPHFTHEKQTRKVTSLTRSGSSHTTQTPAPESRGCILPRFVSWLQAPSLPEEDALQAP